MDKLNIRLLGRILMIAVLDCPYSGGYFWKKKYFWEFTFSGLEIGVLLVINNYNRKRISLKLKKKLGRI